MGACRHWQGGGVLAPGKVVKCFGVLIMTVKRSLDELGLFMHYFQNIRQLLEVSLPDPHRDSVYGPRWGTEAPDPLICPPLEKILRAPRAQIGANLHQ